MKLINNYVFSNKPYQKDGAYEFIKATKRGDLSTMKKYLEINKFLVYDFDDVFFSKIFMFSLKCNHF